MSGCNRMGSRVLIGVVALAVLVQALAACGFQRCEAVPPPDTIPSLGVGNGMVFLGAPYNQALYAFSAANGSLRWKADSALLYADPDTGQNAILNGVVLARRANGDALALRPSDGKTLWSLAGVVVGTGEGLLVMYVGVELEAVALPSGAVLWKRSLGTGLKVAQGANGLLYFLGPNGYVVALRASDGTTVWEYHGASGATPTWSLTIQDGVVYAADNHLYALRASDGMLLWQRPLSPNGYGLTLAFGQGQVYLSGAGSTLITALRASDGKMLWQADVAKDLPTEFVNSQVDLLSLTPFHLLPVQDRLFVGFSASPTSYGTPSNSPHLLTTLRASDGAQLWSKPESEDFAFQVAGEVGFVLTSARIEAVQLSDGTPLWQQSLQAVGMLAAAGAIYAGTAGVTGDSCFSNANGPSRLSKLDASTGALLWQAKE